MALVGGLAAAAFTLSAATGASAETARFYSNTGVGGIGTPTSYGPGDNEFADDVPFSGSHLVSSFSFGYTSPEPVHATFRFYGVDPVTELLGEQVAQIERDLPAGEAISTVSLSDAERFTWTAEPNLYPGEFKGVTPTGGWYSIQFSSATTDQPAARFRLASGTSSYGMLDVETGQIVTVLDPSGNVPNSHYLIIDDAGSSGVVEPGLASLVVSPATVKAGGTAQLRPFLDAAAPPTGTTVTLTSSNPRIAGVVSEIVIPAAGTNLNTTVTTKRRVNSPQTVTLTATANGTTVSTQLTVTP